MRLTAKTLPEWRAKTLADQDGRCALCRDLIPADEVVADHDHATGHMRGVLHRGCNAMLGHLENNRARNKLKDLTRFARFLSRVGTYLASQPHPEVYPTHRTDDEKRIARNKKARTKRALAK
jgi:hypothetical protein